MSAVAERLERLLGGPALRGLRERLRRRYELGRTNDLITLASVSSEERRALEGLLGRRSRDSESMQVSIAQLDDSLARAGLASSLRNALEQLDGPIRNIAAERADREARWIALFATHDTSPLRSLVAITAGQGLVKRLAGSDPDLGRLLLNGAAEVVASLPAAGVPLSHLAAQTLGDSHALDDGKPIGTLALAALRSDSEERPREIWARFGVLVGELASPALALNLFAAYGTICGDLTRCAKDRGEPVHLSLRVLLRTPANWDVRGREVFVCENPAVVAMAADRLGTHCQPLVCTDGMPGAAQRVLLRQLGAAGAILRYHGDFDWPGITIGNFVRRTFGALPWRFSAEDYTTTRGRTLDGAPVAASWDPALSPKMQKHGSAMDEEVVVNVLLQDLAS